MFRVLEFRVIKVLSVDLRDFVPGGATLLHRCVKHACEEVFYLQNISGSEILPTGRLVDKLPPRSRHPVEQVLDSVEEHGPW